MPYYINMDKEMIDHIGISSISVVSFEDTGEIVMNVEGITKRIYVYMDKEQTEQLIGHLQASLA